MHNFMLTLIKNIATKLVISSALLVSLSLSLVGLAAPAAAHTYSFGVSDLSVNPNTQHIEVIHQFTAHDIENAIAQLNKINFSPEHIEYNSLIEEYFEKRFVLTNNQKVIPLNWIGFEVKSGQLIAYQESINKNFLPRLVVKNTILVDTYPNQVNTVNYQDNKLQGSLTFNRSQKVAKITASEIYASEK
ncbi:MAG: hypothetical protein OCD00_07560 [Colwellia sp.]